MGGIRANKRSRCSQPGFTMVELVVAVAISAVILVGIGAGLRAILVSSANSTNHALAMSEVQKVASWIGDDVVQAQEVDIRNITDPLYFLSLRWDTGSAEGGKLVYYSVGNMTDKQNRNLWRLYRTEDPLNLDLDKRLQTVVAEYLQPFDPTNPSGTTSCSRKQSGNGTLENVLVLNVASQVDAYRASASYQISPRAFNVNWGALIYTLTYTAGANGFLLPPGYTSQTVIPGDDGIAVMAVPDSADYFFVRWSDGSIANPRQDTNVQGNIWVTAVFGSEFYTITASAGSGGNITPSGNLPPVDYGGNKTFTIAANAGYCTTVAVDGGSVGNVTSYQFTNVTANHTIAATFVMPTISASAGAGGSMSPSGNVSVNCGENQAFTITPNAHYHVADVLVDGGSVGNVTSYSFTNLTYNHTIAATFAIDTYTISASAGSGGSISPSGAVVVNYGGNQTFSITANTGAGYHIGNVTVDGGSIGNVTSYTFSNVTAAHTIAASFAINTYTLTYSAGANGSISGTSPQMVNHGGNGTAVTAVPNTGYYFVKWSDGVTTASRTDTNVQGNISVTANFAIDPAISASACAAGGSISPSGNVSVTYGGNETFTITANTGAGYQIANVVVDGVSKGAIGNYTFPNVTANHTISASFAANTGFSAPTTYTDGGSWTNPENGYTSDNAYATTDKNNKRVSYSSFTFASIPGGSTISGIEVRVEGSTTGRQVDVDLSWDNGSNYTSGTGTGVKATTLATTEGNITLGGSTDKWGTSHTWVQGDFTGAPNATFRVRLTSNSAAGIISVDQVQVKVYYTCNP